MTLSKYQRWAYRLFGQSLKETAEENDHLRMSLQKAHIYMRPEVYLSFGYMNMAVAFAGGLLLVLLVGILDLVGLLPIPVIAYAFLVPIPLLLASIVYLLTYTVPDLRASMRARDIDAKLPYAINYIATMANAGVNPDEIFKSLSQQPIYGEVANEAAWISRDLHLLGKDTITALNDAIDRSPSIKFQDLIQGAIATLTSGGNLKDYFLSKSEQFIQENRREQKQFIESLGVLAESFVTVVVATPLFFIVLLTVMATFGGGSSGFTMGYLIILVLLPLSQLGFAVAIDSITPEA